MLQLMLAVLIDCFALPLAACNPPQTPYGQHSTRLAWSCWIWSSSLLMQKQTVLISMLKHAVYRPHQSTIAEVIPDGLCCNLNIREVQ